MQFLKSYFGHLFVKCKFNYQQWKPLIFFYTPCSLKIHILVNFWKSEAKIGQIAENAKKKKEFKCDILSDFQTMWWCKERIKMAQ